MIHILGGNDSFPPELLQYFSTTFDKKSLLHSLQLREKPQKLTENQLIHCVLVNFKFALLLPASALYTCWLIGSRDNLQSCVCVDNMSHHWGRTKIAQRNQLQGDLQTSLKNASAKCTAKFNTKQLHMLFGVFFLQKHDNSRRLCTKEWHQIVQNI